MRCRVVAPALVEDLGLGSFVVLVLVGQRDELLLLDLDWEGLLEHDVIVAGHYLTWCNLSHRPLLEVEGSSILVEVSNLLAFVLDWDWLGEMLTSQVDLVHDVQAPIDIARVDLALIPVSAWTPDVDVKDVRLAWLSAHSLGGDAGP